MGVYYIGSMTCVFSHSGHSSVAFMCVFYLNLTKSRCAHFRLLKVLTAIFLVITYMYGDFAAHNL